MTSRIKTVLLVSALALSVIPASAGKLRQVAVVDLPGRPGFDSVVMADNHLVIAHKSANTVDIFDPVKRRLVAQVKGMKDPRGLAVDEKGSRIFVANSGDNSVAVLSSKNWNVLYSIALTESPAELLYVPEANMLWIANARTNSISFVVADRGQQPQRFETDGRVRDLAYDRGLVLATVEDAAQIVAYDQQGKVAKRYPLAASLPTKLVLDSNTRRLYVAVRYAVLVLNADTGTEIGRVPTAAGTDMLWLDAPGGTLYAASGDGSVNVIRVAGNQFVSDFEIATAVKGRTLAYDAEKKLIYLSGGREGRSKLVILKRFENSQPETAPDGSQIVMKK